MPIEAPPTPTATPYNYPIQDTIWNFLTANIFPIIVFVGLIAIVVITVLIIKDYKKRSKKNMLLHYKDFNQGKFKAKFYRRIANIYHEIGTEEIKISGKDNEEKFVFNGTDFTNFDRNSPAFSDDENKYYAFDFDSKKQLHMKDLQKIPKEKEANYRQIIALIDNWINKNVIRQLTEGLEHPEGSGRSILFIFIALIIGLVAGALIGYFSHTPPPTTTVIQQSPNPIIGVLRLVK